jgi:hypothetical protein
MKNKKNTEVESLLKILSKEELSGFLLRQVQFNPDLTNAIFLEFSQKIENEHQNKYSLVIRRGLEAIKYKNYEDYCYEESYIDLDILDQWFGKAKKHLDTKKFDEAVLIAQACLEEFALWFNNLDGGYSECVSEDYQSTPFDILEIALDNGVDARKLFDYCMTELPKEKYAGTYMYDHFNDLLMILPAEVSGDTFIKLQDTLLDAIKDKSSYAAKKILQRKIEFYKKNHNPREAWKLIKDNIQISAFRTMLVKKKIKNKKFAVAKKLIHDFIDDPQSKNKRQPDKWDDYLLDIAQKEKDVPVIRQISYSFIERSFHKKYYNVYKSTFTKNEWPPVMEALVKRYESRPLGFQRGFHHSAANIFVAENLTERLMLYVGKKASMDELEKYHIKFAADFPEHTLALFRKAIDTYTEANVGRNHYERIAGLLKKMLKIKGSGEVINAMVTNYRSRYKNRRAMLEILGRHLPQ